MHTFFSNARRPTEGTLWFSLGCVGLMLHDRRIRKSRVLRPAFSLRRPSPRMLITDHSTSRMPHEVKRYIGGEKPVAP